MSTAFNGLKLIYGAGGLSPVFVGTLPPNVEFHDYAKQILETLEKEGVSNLDTAEIYPGSEEEIGYHGAANRFTVDTKLPGGFGDPRQKDAIVAGGRASLEKLKTTQVCKAWLSLL
jgi:aflatoxin B1 aldehyde reductase